MSRGFWMFIGALVAWALGSVAGNWFGRTMSHSLDDGMLGAIGGLMAIPIGVFAVWYVDRSVRHRRPRA